MAIIRVNHKASYTVISNELINDARLDYKDVGLLVYLLSKPDHWEVSTAHLQTIKKSGRDAIHASLNAIIKAGYATRKNNPRGGWDYEIFEQSIAGNPNTGNPNTGNPNTGNPNTEKRPQVNTDNKQILIKSINTDKSKSIRDKSRQDKIEKTKRGVFKIPELQEVCRLVADENLSLDAAAFINFYESKGWVIGKSKMKDWKAAARGWSSRNTQKNPLERNQAGLIQINSGVNSNAYNNTNYRKQSTSELQLAACQRAIEREEREQQCRNTEN